MQVVVETFSHKLTIEGSAAAEGEQQQQKQKGEAAAAQEERRRTRKRRSTRRRRQTPAAAKGKQKQQQQKKQQQQHKKKEDEQENKGAPEEKGKQRQQNKNEKKERTNEKKTTRERPKGKSLKWTIQASSVQCWAAVENLHYELTLQDIYESNMVINGRALAVNNNLIVMIITSCTNEFVYTRLLVNDLWMKTLLVHRRNLRQTYNTVEVRLMALSRIFMWILKMKIKPTS